MVKNSYGHHIDRILAWMESMVSWKVSGLSVPVINTTYPKKTHSEFSVKGEPIFNKELYNLTDEDMVFKMDSTLKTQTERVFGADFSDVRIHTGSYATALTRNAGADAVTIGSDIYFNGSMYAPDTEEGISLLVHELQHVVQYHNKDRMVYMEDIQKAEEAAADIEKKISEMRIHNISEPVAEPSPIPYPNTAAQSDRYTALPKMTAESIAAGLDEFVKKPDAQTYEVLFKNGKKYSFTHSELSQLFEEFRGSVEDWLAEQKRSSTARDYDDLVVRVLNISK